MNVTIVGGGNIGTQFAVHCAKKRHRVKIYTSKPERFQRKLFIVDENGTTLHEGSIVEATSDAREAFEDAEMILITVPAYCMQETAETILPHLRKGTRIGLCPGTGGGECAFGRCIEKGGIVFGLQRVPSVARLVVYGKKVCASGYRKELFAAAIPNRYTEQCCRIVSEIFDMACTALPNYLNVTLTPSNPILHTVRMRTLFSDYHKGVTYPSVPLFYEEWDLEASELLIKCDREVQQLCKALRAFDLSYVKSLMVHYESTNAQELTRKLCSIKSLHGLRTPMLSVGNRYIPDMESRYFAADFPYGIAIIKQISDMAGFKTDNINETLDWYYSIGGNQDGFDYKKYGICSYDAFSRFYNQ